MRFQYQHNSSLPRLAWGAVLNSDGILVHHGSGVETHPDFFVEGAWDGPFKDGGFEQAVTFTGTGARIHGDMIRFSSPSHNLERCYSLSKGHSLYLSNSLAFVMTMADERLKPDYPFYYFDFIRCYRTGLRQRNQGIKTLDNLKVTFHDCHNIDIRNSKIIQQQMRDFGRAPMSFDEYHKIMLDTTRHVFSNAADPARHVRYKPLASISTGYDSPATSVLSADAGCEDAFTFRRSNANDSSIYQDDNGQFIARQLGLNCEVHDRINLCDARPDLLKLHFQNPFGSIVSSMDQASDLLLNRIFVTGRHGEHFWSLDPARSLPWYQEPTARKTLVQNTLEFRLDRGYIDFHLPYTCGVFAPSLLKISRSDEMAAFRIGGNYDRPIPRRIVEQAGVSREQFGLEKKGGAEDIPALCTFSEESKTDFNAFYETYVPDSIINTQRHSKRGRFGYYEHGFSHGLDRWLRTQYGLRTISEYVLGFRNHQRRYSPYLYAFHWGFEFVAERYRQVLRKT